MRRRPLFLIIATVLTLVGSLLLAPGVAVGKPRPAPSYPDSISLPNGFQPEGISVAGNHFFVGSRANGAIYRGSLRTGQGSVLVPGATGRVALGTEVDSKGRLWVAGGTTGAGRVYDARSGRQLASWQFATGTTFVNDVVVTRRAAFFTDSNRSVLYVVPLGWHGWGIGTPYSLPLTGDLGEPTAGTVNVNGIETTPDRRSLIVVQSNTGLLFTVNPRTGATAAVDTGGVSLINGDGLLRLGRTLYVVQNQLNQIRPLRLARDGGVAVARPLITNPLFDVPATVAYGKGALYAVNARFTTPATPDTTYTVVRSELRWRR